MSVRAAWSHGYTGAGSVVSILDDGIQKDHPDLVLNYDAEASTDINDNDHDPTPRNNGRNALDTVYWICQKYTFLKHYWNFYKLDKVNKRILINCFA